MTRLIFARCVLLAVVLALLVPALVHRATGADGGSWGWPLEPTPRVVHTFDPPDGPYGTGHRGVDLAGDVGQPVHAIGAGTVAFVGTVAGQGVVVVDHGRLRSTYEPVTGLVAQGEDVAAGEPIGTLQLVHSHCLPDPCLHLGVKLGATYIDPLGLLPRMAVRLKPLEGLESGDGGSARWSRSPREQQPRHEHAAARATPAASGALFGVRLGDGPADRRRGGVRW